MISIILVHSFEYNIVHLLMKIHIGVLNRMKQKIDIILTEIYKTLLEKYNRIGLPKLWMEVK